MIRGFHGGAPHPLFHGFWRDGEERKYHEFIVESFMDPSSCLCLLDDIPDAVSLDIRCFLPVWDGSAAFDEDIRVLAVMHKVFILDEKDRQFFDSLVQRFENVLPSAVSPKTRIVFQGFVKFLFLDENGIK